MSTLWKVQDFLAELVHLQKLCQLLPDEAQHGPMVTAFLLKAQAVQKWSSQDIVALLEKAQELNFTASMSNQLKDGITKLCQNEGSHVKLVQAAQVVSNLAPYLTEEDWLQLGNKRSQVCQLTVLAQRLRAMGLTSLKEDTKCQAVALWLYSHVELKGMPEPQATTLHTMVAEFQAVFQSLDPNPAVPSLHTYPDNPATLPEDWTKKAYGEERPWCKVVHLALWKKKVPLRSTASKLVAKSAAKAKAVPQAVEPAPKSVGPLLEQLLAKFAATQKADQESSLCWQGQERRSCKCCHVRQQANSSSSGFAKACDPRTAGGLASSWAARAQARKAAKARNKQKTIGSFWRRSLPSFCPRQRQGPQKWQHQEASQCQSHGF